jgi:Zn-dependent protease with chaperone function
MRRAFDLLLGVAALTAGACVISLLGDRCPSSMACMAAGMSMHGSTITGRVLELAAVAVACSVIGRTVWIVRATARTCSALVTVGNPPALASAVARTGIRRVRCVEAAPVPAFCYGVIRPSVVMEIAAAAALSDAALDAVLLHEEAHRRHRDPLRRALRQAVIDIGCRSSALRWWRELALVREELRADAWAARRVGAPALASALLSLAPTSEMTSMPAFGDAADARVTQLLGDRPLLPRMPTGAFLRSGLAALGVLAIAVCAAMSSI